MAEPDFRKVHDEAIAEIAEIAGVEAWGDVFAYASHPTPTQAKYVFQSWVGFVPEVTEVCNSMERAAENVSALLAWCRANPERAREMTEHYRQQGKVGH